jgi:hypothetical protein
MSRSRATAVFTAFVTMMAMMTGAVTLTSVTASATPPPSYTPVAPKFKVNTQKTTKNGVVYPSGTGYARGEKVYLTITYPALKGKRAVVKTVVVYASSRGGFSTSVRLTGLGQVSIRARGVVSNKPKTVYVLVVVKRGRGW